MDVERVFDIALGVDAGRTCRMVGVPLPKFVFAGFFHDPSKNMLTARSTLLDDADWMSCNDSVGKVSPIILVKRSTSKPFDKGDFVVGCTAAWLVAG